MIERKTYRCAVYTRKSTEYGLEQDFNSLDAQREACEAYIKSQSHEGWKLMPTYYDDGGISGATLERPALQFLLNEIKARKIDIIVVYKVDRLTRSLADFAKLVELFDAHGVSFVSITQQFNTTTSMGRLTLNVLLSFAQFEREVTAERIRDKILASKQRGIWMGGTVPFGYGVKEKKLFIVQEEAKKVRLIYQLYLEASGLKTLKRELDSRGIVTRTRTLSDGRIIGGIPFFLGPLNHILKSRLYIGETTHAGKSYAGQHEAIIEKTLFDSVQAKMVANKIRSKNQRGQSNSILMGRIFDDAGNRMTPVHSLNGSARYRYYQSSTHGHASHNKSGSLSRLPAHPLEETVLAIIRGRFISEDIVAEGPGNSQQLIDDFVTRVVVARGKVTIECKVTNDGEEHSEPEILVAPLVLVNRKPRRDIIRDGDITSDPDIGMRVESHRRLVLGIAQARRWAEELISGKITDTAALAKRENCSERSIRIALPLAFLAPDIVTSALANRLPPHLVMTKIAANLPLSWTEQRNIPGIRPV